MVLSGCLPSRRQRVASTPACIMFHQQLQSNPLLQDEGLLLMNSCLPSVQEPSQIVRHTVG